MIEPVCIVDQNELNIIFDMISEYQIQNGIVFSDSVLLRNAIKEYCPKICLENDFDDSIIEAFLKYQNNTNRNEMGLVILDNYIDDERVNWMVENLHSYNILLIMTMAN